MADIKTDSVTLQISDEDLERVSLKLQEMARSPRVEELKEISDSRNISAGYVNGLEMESVELKAIDNLWQSVYVAVLTSLIPDVMTMQARTGEDVSTVVSNIAANFADKAEAIAK